MIVALLALFVALGGVGYAAVKINGKSIRNRSIPGKKVKKNSLTSKEVRNQSLLAKDFRAGQLPRGETGPTGAAGPPGVTGASGATSAVMRQGPDVTIDGSDFAEAQVDCNPGEVATGGGLYNETSVKFIHLTSSYPIPNPTMPPPTGNGKVPTGWRVWAHNTITGPQVVNAYVICVKP